jgi:hypothetical protein
MKAKGRAGRPCRRSGTPRPFGAGEGVDRMQEPPEQDVDPGAPCAREFHAVACQALAPIVARRVGVDLRSALRRGHLRLVVVHTAKGGPLPADWAIPLKVGEAVVACAALKVPCAAVAALVARVDDLPKPKLDEAARERVAQALADAAIAEMVEHDGGAPRPRPR